MRAIVFVMLIAAAAAARGDEDSTALARAHFIAGQSFYDQHRFAEALTEFEEAHRVSTRPALLYNIGVCHEHLGHLDDAIGAFERYLAAVPDAEDRTAVEQRIAKLKQDKATLSAPSPPRDKKPPPRRRAWIWGVVAGAVVVVAVGVTVGVVFGAQDTTRTLPAMRPE